RGELQLVVESLQRVGVGTLYEEFLRLRARLAAQGLFDAARKRALPRYPLALGVVTSPAAAALHDVLTALARRAPQLRVVIYPTLVQGAEAPAAIVGALAVAAQRREVDLLLLVRGGGALEDLWAFNDERVVRAIVASPLPVICGVGHETDLTLADLAADLRAPTPTAAAEMAAPPVAELLAALDARQAAIARGVERALAQRAQRLDALALRLGRPARALLAQRDRLHGIAQRLARALRPALAARSEALALRGLRLAHAARSALQRQQAGVDALAARLAAEDPARVLARGYAWVESADGRAVTSVAALAPGSEVRAVWRDGQARAEVLEVLPLPPRRR
ncbi:MAG TPA: exodeoxyribonuclease VII large subunit, partial [Rubrivivax sp.]|nr:exodeoxyribonuclease VII large subunit [Rubrivivax sp.]